MRSGGMCAALSTDWVRQLHLITWGPTLYCRSAAESARCRAAHAGACAESRSYGIASISRPERARCRAAHEGARAGGGGRPGRCAQCGLWHGPRGYRHSGAPLACAEQLLQKHLETLLSRTASPSTEPEAYVLASADFRMRLCDRSWRRAATPSSRRTPRCTPACWRKVRRGMQQLVAGCSSAMRQLCSWLWCPIQTVCGVSHTSLGTGSTASACFKLVLAVVFW
jgi:hypothetical protein